MPSQTPKKNTFGWVVTGAVVAVSIIMGAVFFATVQKQEQERSTAVPALSAGMGQPIVIGEETAEHTLTLFADFQCPFCKEFENYFGNAILDAVAKGTTKVEFYPVAFLTPGSALATNAAACAADQGKYYEYHQSLFIHQPAEGQGVQFTEDLLLALGESTQIGDQKEFQRCVSTNKYQGWTEALLKEMERREIQGTPAVFLDGEVLDYSEKSELDMAVLLGVIDAPAPTPTASNG